MLSSVNSWSGIPVLSLSLQSEDSGRDGESPKVSDPFYLSGGVAAGFEDFFLCGLLSGEETVVGNWRLSGINVTRHSPCTSCTVNMARSKQLDDMARSVGFAKYCF